MSKKGQHNISGIDFQLCAALLYCLKEYKQENFIKARFEGVNFSDFTLFFKDPLKNKSFIHNIEVKSWKRPLKENDIKKLVKKEIDEREPLYQSRQYRFLILAPKFDQRVKSEIQKIKDNIPLHRNVTEEILNLFKKEYKDINMLQEWNRKNLLFLKNVDLMEIDQSQINNQILEHFRYQDCFFYREDDLKNIQNLLLEKIKEKSKTGGYLIKTDIEKIISKFKTNETDKSESYNLDKSLVDVIKNIKSYFETEKKFKVLNDDKFLTPISQRRNVVFSIAKELEKKKFKLKDIKFFIDKILIKHDYFYSCMDLLEKYIEDNYSEKEILKILESLSRRPYFNFHYYRVLELLYKISESRSPRDSSENFNSFALDFLEKIIPDFSIECYDDSSCSYFMNQYVPKLIKNIFKDKSSEQKQIDWVFKKYNFIKDDKRDINPIPVEIYEYIQKFISADFKPNFQIIINKISEQCKKLYKKKYNVEYEGFEMSGGSSGVNREYNLHDMKILSLSLEPSIEDFYKKNHDKWELLKPFIFRESDMFVKRSFVPFLLRRLKDSSENNQKKEFSKALDHILKIKKGFPRSEELIAYNLYMDLHLSQFPTQILKSLIRNILYKYSKDKIYFDVFLFQLLIKLTEMERSEFEGDLENIILAAKSENVSIFSDLLMLLSKRIHSPHIRNFTFKMIEKNILSLPELAKRPKQNVVDIYDDIYDFLYTVVEAKLKEEDKASGIKTIEDFLDAKAFDFLSYFIYSSVWNSNPEVKRKILEFIESVFEDQKFLEGFASSENLRSSIANMGGCAVGFNKMQLAEKIIELCLKDRSSIVSNSPDKGIQTTSDEIFCRNFIDPDFSDKEHPEVKAHNKIIKGEEFSTISGMRCHLCYAIDAYLIKDFNEEGEEFFKRREKAFRWIKTLIDLDGSLSGEIKGCPKPANYYWRVFALKPLTNLSLYPIRKNLNSFKKGLGDEVKKFAFRILDQTEKDIKNYGYNPQYLFENIAFLFDKIRDLNEKEAKTLLDFMQKYNVRESNQLFIYFAVFRKEHLSNEEKFDSSYFDNLLQNICKGEPKSLKQSIAFTIYKNIENNKESGNNSGSEPSFSSFEKVKDYWILLFENFNDRMVFPLSKTLSFILNKKKYYKDYIKYLFKITDKALNDYDLKLSIAAFSWKEFFSAIRENNPDDLAKILLEIFKKGDKSEGSFPFSHQMHNSLIPEWKKQKSKISDENNKKIEEYLREYNLLEEEQ